MNWSELFDRLDSCADMGMKADVKEYLSNSDEIKNYKLILDKDNILLVDIIFLGKDEKIFIYDFMSFISYNHFCFIYKEKKELDSIYYLYTEIDNDKVGIKIVMNIKKV